MKNKNYIFLILGLVILFFLPVVLNPTEMLYSKYSDLKGQYFYWKSFIFDSVSNYGELPLWNPHTFGGQPFVGNFHSELFYPLFLFFYFIPGYLLFGWVYILHFFIAGVAMYFLLKQYKVSSFGSFMGSLMYIFSGYLTSHIFAGHLSFLPTIICVPFIFLFFEKAIFFRSYFYGVVCSFFIAIQLLGAHPQFFVYTMFVFLFYFLYRLSINYFKDNDIAGSVFLIKVFCVIALLSILLSSIQILPSIEATLESTRGDGVDSLFATKLSMPPWEIIGFIMPDFFGSNIDDTYWGRWSSWEINGYVGIIGLILAILAVLYSRNSYVLFFFLVSIFALLFAFGKYSPLFWIFYKFVPGFDMFRGPAKMLFFYTFSTSILAGFGATFLINAERKIIKKLLTVFLWLLLAFGLVLSILLLFKNYIISFGTYVMTILFNKYSYTATVQKLGLDYLLNLVVIIFNQIKSSFFNFILMLSIAFIVFLSKIKFSKHFKVFLVVGLLFQLFFFNIGYVGTKDVSDIYTIPSELDYISSDVNLFRVVDVDSEISQSVFIQRKIQIIDGYDPTITSGYSKYLSSLAGLDFSPRETIPISNISNINMLNMLNIKYILSNNDLKGYTHLTGDLYLNDDYLPRAYVIHDYLVSSNSIETIDFNPREKAVFEEDPLISLDGGDFYEANVTYYSNNRIDIYVEDTGLLILSENFYPGWKAYLNDEELNIYKVNGIQRAVFFEESGLITFVYEPLTFKIGLWISILTLAVLIVLGMYRWMVIKR